jgi:hypothetical protein
MAVTAPTSVGAAYTTLSNTTSAFTTTATAPSGSLMIMGAAGWNASGTGSQLIVLSGGGLTWTREKHVNSGQFNLDIFTAPAPSGLASGTVLTATYTGNHNGKPVGGGYVTGQDVVPTETSSSATGTGASSNAGTMTTVTVDLAVGIMFADFTGGSTSTAGTNYTELFDVANATNNQTFTMVYRVDAPTGSNTPVNTWGAAVTTWLGVSVAIAPVGAIAGPSVSTPAFNAIPFLEGLNL